MLDRAKTIGRRLTLAFSPTPVWRQPAERPERLVIAAFGHVGDLVILQSFLRGLLTQHAKLWIRTIGPEATPAILGPLRDEFGAGRISITVVPRHEAVTFRWGLADGWSVVIAPYLHDNHGTAIVRSIQKMRGRGPALISFDGDTGLNRKLHIARIQKTIRKDMTIHETENLRRLFGLGTDPPMFDAEPLPAELTAQPEALARVAEWRAGLPEEARARPLLVLNPDAAYAQKEWPEENWIALMEGLLRTTDCALAVNLSREPHALGSLLSEKFAGEPRVAAVVRWPLGDLIALLSVARGVITVDSAPQHLAHALNVPSLTLYGPMDERRWADRWRRPMHRTLRAGMFDLTREELRGLPENHLMRLITPERALQAAGEWLRSVK